LNMPLDVLGVQIFMLGMVSILSCMIIEKLDKATTPDYVRKSLSQSRNNKRRE
jgi:hypothetical protein